MFFGHAARIRFVVFAVDNLFDAVGKSAGCFTRANAVPPASFLPLYLIRESLQR